MAVSSSAGSVQWWLGAQNISTARVQVPLVPANQNITVSLVLTVSADCKQSMERSSVTIRDFASVFAQLVDEREADWAAVFTPNNTRYSGSLPVLVTNDSAIAASVRKKKNKGGGGGGKHKNTKKEGRKKEKEKKR